MKPVLDRIQQRTREFSELPVFRYMADRSIDPAQRLALAPCMAHYVMTFADMNAHVLREEPARDRYQELVNVHTQEDASHWPWFAADLARLGLDRAFKFSEVLEFLWGDATVKSRLLSYEMCRLSLGADSLHKLAIVECVEATGSVFLGVSAGIGEELRARSDQEYTYYGANHFSFESGHTMGTDDVESELAAIPLTPEQRETLLALVDRVFALYTEFVGELFAYATAHPIEQLRQQPLGPGRRDRRGPAPRGDRASEP